MEGVELYKFFDSDLMAITYQKRSEINPEEDTERLLIVLPLLFYYEVFYYLLAGIILAIDSGCQMPLQLHCNE